MGKRNKNSIAIKNAEIEAHKFWKRIERDTNLVLNNVESGKIVTCEGSQPIEFSMEEGVYYEKMGGKINRYHSRLTYRSDIEMRFYTGYNMKKVTDPRNGF